MTSKFHINDKGPALCKAKIKCPLANESEHFDNIKDAQNHYEKQLESELGLHGTQTTTNKSQNSITDHALNSSLKYSGETPSGFNTRNHNVLIDSFATDQGQVLVAYSQKGIKFSETDAPGFHNHRITYVSEESGRSLGYLRMRTVSDESIEEAWGSDEMTSFRHLEKHDRPNAFSIPEDYDSLYETEKIEVKRYILERVKNVVQDFDYSVSNVVSHEDTEKAKDFSDEEVNEKFDTLKQAADNSLKEFKDKYEDAFVDYIELQKPLRGKGIGNSLYVYGGRVLAEKNKRLRGSNNQTEEAVKSWQKMIDSGLPITEETRAFDDQEYLYLDFRKK